MIRSLVFVCAVLVGLIAGCTREVPAGTDAGPVLVDSGVPDSDIPDAGLPIASAECGKRCDDFGSWCPAQVSGEACNRACAVPGIGAQLEACLVAAKSCEEAAICGDTYRAPPSVPFNAGPYGLNPRDVAGNFTLQTTDGPWTFEEEWTGQDSYIFVVHYPSSTYSQALFNTQELLGLLAASPRNVHYFFLRTGASAAFDGFVSGSVTALNGLPAEDYAHWRGRVHFGADSILNATGWLGDLVRARQTPYNKYDRYGRFQFAVDPAQRVREVGMLGTLQDSSQLQYLANEAAGFNFEMEREARLAQDNATVVTALTDFVVTDWEGQNNWRDAVAYPTVEFPDAAAMAGFDTLEVDLAINCLNHRDADCGAWDYSAHLYICDGNPEPVGEDCTREGKLDADGGIVVLPDGGLQKQCYRSARPGCDKEIARQMTPYWREGRWVTDLSQMLPLLKNGGAHTFRWNAKHQFHDGSGPGREVPYVLSLSFRLGRKSDAARPSEIVRLWSVGGNLNTDYVTRNPPATFTLPEGVTKAELVTLITGHGMETPYNCAEFCDHRHHFRVNGKAAHTLMFPEVGQEFGCSAKVDQGVVPNQSGTWYYGRAGWCPGQDVKPWVVDITADLQPGENTIDYSATYMGNPLITGTKYGNIDLEAYLVFYR